MRFAITILPLAEVEVPIELAAEAEPGGSDTVLARTA